MAGTRLLYDDQPTMYSDRMNDQQQAYAGQGSADSGTSEWNRLDAAVRSVLNKMATMTLVKVLAVNGRKVDIQPIVAQLDGAGNAIPHGTIHNVPVWRYQAGGVAVVIDPIAGDIGMAVFAHSDISTAKATGKESPPGSKRRFDWADAVYLGGLFGSEPTTSIRLGPDGVSITSDQPVMINATAGTTVNGPLTAAQGLTVMGGASIMGGLDVDGKPYALHKHSGVTTGGGISGPVSPV